jgi:hypothetical protein
VVCTFTNTQDGSITIVKSANPANSSQSFSFAKAGDFSGSFTLTGQSANDANREVITGLAPGRYTVQEGEVDGWLLTRLRCDGEDTGASVSNRRARIDLAAGENVTCTFTNTQLAEATVAKVTDPSGAEAGWEFVLERDDDGWTEVARSTTTGAAASSFGAYLDEGSYRVVEVGRDGWDLTGVALDGDPLTGTACTFTVDFPADAGQTYDCVFTNTQRGEIEVVKRENGDRASSAFTFRLTGGPDDVDESLTTNDANGGVLTFTDLRPGTYTLCEVGLLEGWVTSLGEPDENGDVCITVELGAGESWGETVDNLRLAEATVAKVTDPAGAEAGWTFTLERDGGEGWEAIDTVTTDGTDAIRFDAYLDEGDHRVVETPRGGWDLTGVTLDGVALDAEVCSFSVSYPGDATHVFDCVFTNTQRGTVTVVKTQDGQTPTEAFTFRLTGGPDEVELTRTTSADNGGMLDFGQLKPGTYELCELGLPAGWTSSLGTPDEETGDICIEVELEAGEAYVANVDNVSSPGIEVVKTADTDSAEVGEVVTYTYVITNTGNVTLTDVTLDDDVIGPIELPVEGVTLEPGASVTVTATYTITEQDGENGSVTNVAVASGQPPTGPRVEDSDDWTVDVPEVIDVVFEPGISVEKSALVDTDAEGNRVVTVPEGGTATIAYRYVVTNTGDEAITDLTLDDDKIGDLTDELVAAVTAAYGEPVLPVGGSVTVEATYTTTAADLAAGEVTNVALVRGVGAESGEQVEDEDAVTVSIVEVLGVVQRQPLPFTGADMGLLLTLGLLMAALGAATLFLTPRRRQQR